MQIHQIASRYVWKGAIEHSDEWALSIKARAADFEEIAAAIRALHSYELPEIIALPLLAADAAYADWLAEATERSKS